MSHWGKLMTKWVKVMALWVKSMTLRIKVHDKVKQLIREQQSRGYHWKCTFYTQERHNVARR
jgi:hypothetical protein